MTMDILYVPGDKDTVVVGRDPGSDLVIPDPVVSRRHLILTPVTDTVAVLEVAGANGAIAQGAKLVKENKFYVRAGDCIEIGSYTLVYEGRRQIRRQEYVPSVGRMPDIVAEPVEIEGPPPRRIPEKSSVLLAAGPALTMAVPILLGAGRAVAILSSVFAALWAAANVIGRIRKQRSEERRRKNTYMSYLLECETEIKKRRRDTAIKLNTGYPDISGYLGLGADPFLLWKMADDERFLVRLGTGNIKSFVDVIVPKERFASVDDSLKELPGLIRKKYSYMPECPVTVDLFAKNPVVFRLNSEKDRQMLSSFILQICVSHPPDRLRISACLKTETMRYYMWLALLPHYIRGDVACPKQCLSVLITDEASLSYSSGADKKLVILAVYGKAAAPFGAYIAGSGDNPGTVYDTIHPKLCFSYASELSGLWRGPDEKKPIPKSVDFGRLFDVGLVSDEQKTVDGLAVSIGRRYAENDITKSFAAPIGIVKGDEKLFLDLHEKAQGPHGLIAGMTGSGKSELLTTMILSFAACYPPDKLAFFLIDYKGGGMSNLFTGLPHMTGSISNLSGSHVRRAMIALRSENIRRQKIFAGAGVNNINDYTKMYDAGAVTDVLPHVLIIVDEFAELRKEEPDFMDRLISISQTGRSLGIHLILATQRPAGVVDDKIRGNSKFRIALRLSDRSDSVDMLGCDDAAKIRQCGQAYLLAGSGETYECFQSGYAMAPLGSKQIIHIYDDLLMKNELYVTDPAGNEENESARTWFELFFEAIKQTSEKMLIKKTSPMYLPDLPENVSDDGAYAICDNPYMQKYEKAYYDPVSSGHLLICGRSRTGKSELVNAILQRLNGRYSLYIIDCGGGVLADFRKKTYCGGYINEDEPPDILRMTGFLLEETEKRRKSGICDGPDAVLVLDDIAAIRSIADPEAAEQIQKILLFGAGSGIYVIATSMGIPEPAFLKHFEMRLFLGTEEPYTLASYLRAPVKDIPVIRDCPGRGVGVWERKVLEFQAATATAIPDEETDGNKTIRAPSFPHISEDPSLDELLKRGSGYPGGHIPAGFELRSGKVYTVPAKSINCMLISGKPYSGRHTFLFDIQICAARLNIKCIRADTYESLIAACRQKEGSTLIAVESIGDILEEFYSSDRTQKEEDELASCLENPPAGLQKNNTHVIIAIAENDIGIRFSKRKICESMMARPYGIWFGGCLDECRIFDFSYMQFSLMQKRKKRYVATVLRYDEKMFAGDIIIPGQNNVDNSKAL